MEVICEKYNKCNADCGYKKFHYWNEIDNLNQNFCYHVYENVRFLKQSDLRKKKLEKLNESNL